MSDDEEVEVCGICEEILLGGAALREHMEEAHPKPNEEVSCTSTTCTCTCTFH